MDAQTEIFVVFKTKSNFVYEIFTESNQIILFSNLFNENKGENTNFDYILLSVEILKLKIVLLHFMRVVFNFKLFEKQFYFVK